MLRVGAIELCFFAFPIGAVDLLVLTDACEMCYLMRKIRREMYNTLYVELAV